MIKQLRAMPKYEAYKDSGTEWLGEIPTHWKNQRLKFFSSLKARIGFHGLNTSHFIEEGPICITGTDFKNGDIDFRSCYHVSEYWHALDKNIIVKNGDVLVTKDGTIGKVAVVESLPCKATLNSGVFLLRPKENSRYVFWLLNSDVFETQIDLISRGSTIKHLYERDFKNFYFLTPPFPEQTAIAAFLDRKTVQIDQAVAIKEKQIALLKERKQILIQNAVTRGLNSNAPMRDSGVEWIGEIPAHWKVSCSKWLFSQRKERARKSDEQLTASQKYGVISQQVFMELEGRRVTQVVYNNEILKHVEANDFVISMRSFQGGIEFCPYTGSVSSAYVPLIPGNKIHYPYYKYLFKCQRYIEALQSTSNLVRDGQALRYENFTMVDLPVVPLNEQEEIAQYIDTESAKIDRAISIQQQQIDKLKEYKATLINSAVTGKIKVPELVEGRVIELAEAPIPEPVEGELVEDSVA